MNSLLEDKQLICKDCKSETFELYRVKFDDLHKTVQFKAVCKKCKTKSFLLPHYLDEDLEIKEERHII